MAIYSGFSSTIHLMEHVIPSGEHTKSYGKIHHFSWENPRFLWPFSIAMVVHEFYTCWGSSWGLLPTNTVSKQRRIHQAHRWDWGWSPLGVSWPMARNLSAGPSASRFTFEAMEGTKGSKDGQGVESHHPRDPKNEEIPKNRIIGWVWAYFYSGEGDWVLKSALWTWHGGRRREKHRRSGTKVKTIETMGEEEKQYSIPSGELT